MAEAAKILVVEDDPDMVEAIRLVLEDGDYEVLSAGSADEAWEQATTNRPDVILLDIMMPDGTEGFHFVWKLRSQAPEDVRETPIVIITALHSLTGTRFWPDRGNGTYESGEFLPVQAFMDKPVEPKSLIATVGAFVG